MWWRFLKALKGGEHRVAPTTWIAATAAVVYAVSPIDLIPELVLGPLGFTDDLGVWSVLALLLVREHHRWQSRLQAP
ncbi:MAG TPA: YkvA family protein [Microbacterium sp.]|nr:YkvA family protein [Microbacterium sp.]